jgi:hypothetical protein
MATGYSGTPLPQKLGIKEGHLVGILGAPSGFDLGALPTGTRVAKRLTTGTSGKVLFDVLVVFVKKQTDLVAQLGTCRPRMQQDAGLWIAWPKKSSGVATDIVEDTIRHFALPTGLVDNKVCAIDETWSGLRLVIRREHRKL